VGSCSPELSQLLVVQGAKHKVPVWLSEGTGECWLVAAVTEGGEYFEMLYQTQDFTENIQLCSVLATLLPPKCKPGFLQPEREWQQWVLQTA